MSGIFSTPQVQRAPIRRSYRVYARYGWLLCSAMLLLGVIALRWLLSLHHAFPGDPWAARLGASHKPWLVYAITRVYQQVGRPIVAVGEVVVMLAWLWRTGGRRSAQGLLIALLASAMCGLIKAVCGPTPVWLALHHVGSNFPSGVVTFVTAAGGYLGAVARRQGRMITPAVLLVVIAGAGPARVLGGQHLLSDALGGYMLGTAWLIVALIYLVGPGYAAGEGRRAGELALPTAWLRYELGNLVPAVNMSVGNETTMTMRSRPMAATEKAILAGGCFWGVQDLVRKLDGVSSTRVGYTGGDTPNATYRNHGSHAEAIEILFDPERISYRDLLEFFFQIHDPTTKNRQGNDVGASYRSAIYYVDDEQRRIAEDTIADVDASGLWPGKVVTEVEPAGPFWEAEPEHQDYLERYPNGYTCHFVRPGWKLPRRTQEATR